jgi:hypothetical protein
VKNSNEKIVATISIGEKVDNYFDDSSLTTKAKPEIIIITGACAVGKSTYRKANFSTGYVLVDAADIFIDLEDGRLLPFPDECLDPMRSIGSFVAEIAVRERRNIVTEIYFDEDILNNLTDRMEAAGYNISVQLIDLDVDEAMRRNDNRGDDDISSYYTNPFNYDWLWRAAQRYIDTIT